MAEESLAQYHRRRAAEERQLAQRGDITACIHLQNALGHEAQAEALEQSAEEEIAR